MTAQDGRPPYNPEIDAAGVYWAWGRPQACPWCDSTIPAQHNQLCGTVRCQNQWHRMEEIPDTCFCSVPTHLKTCPLYGSGIFTGPPGEPPDTAPARAVANQLTIDGRPGGANIIALCDFIDSLK